jgi:hypothetical protein
MKKLVAAGVLVVVLGEVLALATLERSWVVAASGALVAIVLLALRWYLIRNDMDESADAQFNAPEESLRRWLSRTETLVSRAESTRRDWDRHMRPMLARQFELATGHRQAKDPAAFRATGTMLFGAELWSWVDPQNVSRTGGEEPGPGRAALDEILQRLERV